MKSIAVFNNKGGVGKTTLLANIASYLKLKKGERVLLIDADPQCNASIYSMSDEFITTTYSQANPSTFYNAIKIFRKDGLFAKWDDLTIQSSDGFGYDILLGDTRMSNIEDYLSDQWIRCTNGEPTSIKATLFISDLLSQAQSRYDYVFFDVGPSLGAINRSILLSCDFFIIPMSSDIFSLKAVDNISISLDSWKASLNDGFNNYSKKFDGEHFMLNGDKVDFHLQFLGYVTQLYVSRADRPVNAYEQILKKIPTKISSKLKKYYPESQLNNLKLGKVANFNSLIPMSQNSHKSIFSLTGSDGIKGAHFAKVKEFEDVISEIVRNLERNIIEYGKMA